MEFLRSVALAGVPENLPPDLARSLERIRRVNPVEGYSRFANRFKLAVRLKYPRLGMHWGNEAGFICRFGTQRHLGVNSIQSRKAVEVVASLAEALAWLGTAVVVGAVKPEITISVGRRASGRRSKELAAVEMAKRLLEDAGVAMPLRGANLAGRTARAGFRVVFGLVGAEASSLHLALTLAKLAVLDPELFLGGVAPAMETIKQILALYQGLDDDARLAYRMPKTVWPAIIMEGRKIPPGVLPPAVVPEPRMVQLFVRAFEGHGVPPVAWRVGALKNTVLPEGWMLPPTNSPKIGKVLKGWACSGLQVVGFVAKGGNTVLPTGLLDTRELEAFKRAFGPVDLVGGRVLFPGACSARRMLRMVAKLPCFSKVTGPFPPVFEPKILLKKKKKPRYVRLVAV